MQWVEGGRFNSNAPDAAGICAPVKLRVLV